MYITKLIHYIGYLHLSLLSLRVDVGSVNSSNLYFNKILA
jgi:hypothetical protein